MLRMLVKIIADVRSTRLWPPVRSDAMVARLLVAGAVWRTAENAGLLLKTLGGGRPLNR